jgi:hypothetical protein
MPNDLFSQYFLICAGHICWRGHHMGTLSNRTTQQSLGDYPLVCMGKARRQPFPCASSFHFLVPCSFVAAQNYTVRYLFA